MQRHNASARRFSYDGRVCRMRLNENITKLEQNYLFAEIAMRVRRHREEHPEAEILSLGINDVTRPLAPADSEAMAQAAAHKLIRYTPRYDHEELF